MTNKLKDPVFGKIYERVPNSGIFRNEETGMEIKEGWAIANGFKVVEVEPAPKFLFDPNGKMFELDRDDKDGIPIYKHTEMVPRSKHIGYNKAMRMGYTAEYSYCPPQPTSMEWVKIREDSEKKIERENKVNYLINALEAFVQARIEGINMYNKPDVRQPIRKAILDLLCPKN